MSKEIEKHDKKGNLIYRKESNGLIYWWEYNENGHLIYVKNSFGREAWYRYDKKGKQTTAHYKDTDGIESWYKYDKYGEQINITKQVIKEIEFLKRTPISRFKLMEL